MNLYALEKNQKVIYAGHAGKHINYTCLECAQIIRLRSGFHRQPHFYHLQPNHKCRLNGKSMPHLMLQYYLKSILPQDEVELEHPFPAINRIADVAWIHEKIIFEIQCSPINAAEVLQRNKDYASQGYQVVWILHQTRYNQPRVTAAEDALQCSPHYFTNMDSKGKGEIFDQPSYISQGVRKRRLDKVSIDISKPISEKPEEIKAPYLIKQRLLAWPLYFQGDYLHLFYEKDCTNLNSILEKVWEADLLWKSENGYIELSELSLIDFIKGLFFRWIAFPYRSVLRLLLEKTSGV